MFLKNLLKNIIPASYRRIDVLQKKVGNLQKSVDSLHNNIDNLHNNIDNFQRFVTDFVKFSEIQFEAQKIHERTFPKYKNCCKGKDVAIIGTGPTLDFWRPTKGIIQMGVNSAIFAEKLDLDYYFLQDSYSEVINAMKSYHNKKCNFFVGMQYWDWLKPTPLCDIEELNAEIYFFYDQLRADFFPWSFSLDISEKAFMLYYSTIFIPLQFALYTHPKRIFIIGCDCAPNGHFSNHIIGQNIQEEQCNEILKGWKKFEKFAKWFYPDIEIISVNPIALKGLFNDVYTKEFLKAYPEINEELVNTLDAVLYAKNNHKGD